MISRWWRENRRWEESKQRMESSGQRSENPSKCDGDSPLPAMTRRRGEGFQGGKCPQTAGQWKRLAVVGGLALLFQRGSRGQPSSRSGGACKCTTTEEYSTRNKTTRGSESMFQDQRPSAQTFGSRPTRNPLSSTCDTGLGSSCTMLPHGPRPRPEDGSAISSARRSEIQRCVAVRAYRNLTDLEKPMLKRVPLLGRLRYACQAMTVFTGTTVFPNKLPVLLHLLYQAWSTLIWAGNTTFYLSSGTQLTASWNLRQSPPPIFSISEGSLGISAILTCPVKKEASEPHIAAPSARTRKDVVHTAQHCIYFFPRRKSNSWLGRKACQRPHISASRYSYWK